jgi:hypothetical protein
LGNVPQAVPQKALSIFIALVIMGGLPLPMTG